MSRGQPCDPSLPTGDAVVAAMREEELRVATRAVVDVLHAIDPGGAKLLLGDGAQIKHAPVSDPVISGECIQHLVADLVTTAPDPGSDSRRDVPSPSVSHPFTRRTQPLRRFADQATGEAAP